GALLNLLVRITLAHGPLGFRNFPMLGQRPVKKRAVNLFVDADLLDEARRLRINISETLEHRLRSIVRGQQERRWLEEYQEAIASLNAFLDSHGLLASKLRYRPDSE